MTFIIILIKDDQLWNSVKEKATETYNICTFFVNAPLDIIHDLLYDRINYENHLRDYKLERKRTQFCSEGSNYMGQSAGSSPKITNPNTPTVKANNRDLMDLKDFSLKLKQTALTAESKKQFQKYKV